jgi:hypothetical protein
VGGLAANGEHTGSGIDIRKGMAGN